MKSGTDNEMSGANLRRTKGLIVSHILGGLGNQMFQYAFARALATESNRQLLFDLRDYSS
jgi:hypothetical protein